MKGTVKKWLDFKGFGFIKVEDQDDDVFVHHSSLANTSYLKKGQEVEFEIEESHKGPRAVDVKILY
ncbi:cold-shock protein [Candidatus Bathyarchaeota archaeon]|jgi:CspA family cold shock protein|nr:cold-shock protein [Candidatus Bathyarchaeota archaeon]